MNGPSSALLKDTYKLKVTTGGAKALQLAGPVPSPDLLMLDVMMPAWLAMQPVAA